MPPGRLKGQASHNKVKVQRDRYIVVEEKVFERVSELSVRMNISKKSVAKCAIDVFYKIMFEKKGGEEK